MNSTLNSNTYPYTNHSFPNTNIRLYNDPTYLSSFSSTPKNTNPNLHRDFYTLTQSSLRALQTISHITFATHNVNGLNSTVKQQMLIEALYDRDLSFCGITDTRLSSSPSKHFYKYDTIYQPYWNPMAAGAFTGGVGLFIKKDFVTYIQAVKSWKDTILCVDLYLEGRIKIRVMVVYVPPVSSQNRSLRKDTINEIKKIIKDS